MVEFPEKTQVDQASAVAPEVPKLDQDTSKSRISSLKHILKNLRHKTPQVENGPTTDPNFLIPICDITYKEIKNKHPEISAQMQIVLEDIEQKAINNFKIHYSEIFQGVSFSYTKISVDADLIKKIAPLDTNQPPKTETPEGTDQQKPNEVTPPQNRVIFLFVPFAPPPDGSGLSPLDMGIDRVMRNIPRVAHALKNGQTPPNIDIYCIGTPIGFAGESTQEYLDALIKKGLAANGEMFGEFVDKKLKGLDPENTYVLFQGASMGAINANQTFLHIPPQFKEHTQVLLDVPAGHQKPIIPPWTKKPTIFNPKGIQTAAMLGAETVFRKLTDPKMNGGGDRTKLYEYLSKEKNIAPDDSNQSKLKLRCLLETSLNLVKGSPLNTENRSFVRYATFDPLTTGPVRAYDVLSHKGQFVTTHSMARRSTKEHKYDPEYKNNPYPIEKAKVNIPAKQVGKSLQFPNKGTHFWTYTRKFRRWVRAIKYCGGLSKPQAQPKEVPNE